MPYFSGSILTPFAFPSIPIPLDCFGLRKTQEFQRTSELLVIRSFRGREIFSFLSLCYSGVPLIWPAFKKAYATSHPLVCWCSKDRDFRFGLVVFIKKCWICQSNKIFVKTIFLSACAEDHGLCLWMNAQNVARYFTPQSIGASADFAIGG